MLNSESNPSLPGLPGSETSTSFGTVRELLNQLSRAVDSTDSIRAVLQSCVTIGPCDGAFWYSMSARSTLMAVGTRSAEECTQFARELLPQLAEQKVCRWVNPEPQNSAFPVAAVIARSIRSNGCLILTTSKPGQRFSSIDEETALLALGMQIGFRSHAQQATKRLLTGLLHSLAAVIDAKDPYTAGHSERVGRIAVIIGNSMGLSSGVTGDLFIAGLLHDIGKIGIRDVVLWKPDKLTTAEYEEIKQHTSIGERIIAGIEPFRRYCPAIRHHHERYDGTGYPDGLIGEGIPLMARILGLSDALDAMMSPRRYRPARSPLEIDAILAQESGRQFDPAVIQAFGSVRTQIYPPIYQKGIGESAFHAIDTIVNALTDTNPPLRQFGNLRD